MTIARSEYNLSLSCICQAFAPLCTPMPALTFAHPTKYGKGSREWCAQLPPPALSPIQTCCITTLSCLITFLLVEI
jgi:hypothetical protein